MAHSLLFKRSSSRVSTNAGVLLAAAVLVGGGGCLYTDPINMPPTIKIMAPAAVWLGETASFSADASDPNGDAVTVAWMHVAGNCAAADYADPLTWPVPGARGQAYDVLPPDTDSPFCVWASATDRYGAITVAHTQSSPVNHPPVAVITLVTPVPTDATGRFPLYNQLEFSGAMSTHDKMDSLTYTWDLTPAPNSHPPFLSCSTGNKCLSPDLPGDYRVELTVVDGAGLKSVAERTVTVDVDQRPCITNTTPGLDTSKLVRFPTDSVDFAVNSVSDDGDPWPPPNPPTLLGHWTHFSWFVGSGTGGPVTYVPAQDFPAYTIFSNTYSIGEVARVRVEIRDRDPMTDMYLLGCGDDDVCLASPGCFLRMTWTVQY